MSEWVKLSDIGDWLNSRYGPYRRAGIGWGDSCLPDTLAIALQGGSIRARGFSLPAAGRQLLTFSPARPVAIVALSGDVSVAGVAWWGVEIDAAGLEIYCDKVLGPPVAISAPVTGAAEPKARQRPRHVREYAARLISQLWPDGNLPKSQTVIIQAVKVEAERQHNPAPSGDTIRRVLEARL